MLYCKKIGFFSLFLICLNSSAQNTLDLVGLSGDAPASYAYSIRKLSSTYTGNSIQVRRSSDDRTQDIGFNLDGELNQADLLNFVGANNGFITTWYDQSGNGKHLTQATNSKQPRIVNAGTIDRVNGMPTLTFQDTSDLMLAPSMDIQSFSAVRKVGAGGTSNAMRYLVSVPANFDFSIRSSSTVSNYYGDNNGDDFWTTGKIYLNNVNTATYSSNLHALYAYTGTLKTATTFSLSSTFLNRGMYGGDAVSELIVYPSVLSNTEITTIYLHQAKYYNLP